jgi:hypothetical protein
MSTRDPLESIPAGEQPSEDELRAAYEEELSRISATDMIAQSLVSLLNIGAFRLGPPQPGQEAGQSASRDLDQARDAIDAARALLAILERTLPQEVAPLRAALSQLQIAYAREVQAAGGAPEAPAAQAPAPDAGEAGKPQDPGGPGPAQSSGRLWVPGS